MTSHSLTLTILPQTFAVCRSSAETISLSTPKKRGETPRGGRRMGRNRNETPQIKDVGHRMIALIVQFPCLLHFLRAIRIGIALIKEPR